MVINSIRILTIITILFYTCSYNQKVDDLLIGTWATCLNDGKYCELQFYEDNTYIYHIEDESLMLIVGRYDVISNNNFIEIGKKYSLIIDYGNPDTLSIELLSNNELLSVSTTAEEKYKKLSKTTFIEYMTNLKTMDENNYMKKFKERKVNFNCK